VVEPLTDAAVRAVVDAVRARGPEAGRGDAAARVRAPRHERRLVDALARALPGVAVVASHEVHPEPREFERASTTAAEAYARPRVARYVARLAERLAEGGYPAPGVMTSGGGVRAAAGGGRPGRRRSPCRARRAAWWARRRRAPR
jgi:N-methylhydantoinase A